MYSGRAKTSPKALAEQLQVERLAPHAQVVIHQGEDAGHDRRQDNGQGGGDDLDHFPGQRRLDREVRGHPAHGTNGHEDDEVGDDGDREDLALESAGEIPRPPEGVERAAQMLEHDDRGGDGVATGHEDQEPDPAAQQQDREEGDADARARHSGDGDGRHDAANAADQGEDDRLAQPDEKQGPDLRGAQAERVAELGGPAEVGVGDDPNGGGRQEQAGEIRDQLGQEPEDDVLLNAAAQLDVDGEGDGEPQRHDAESQKDPEMATKDRERAIQNLPELHRLQVRHTSLAPCAGWR